jgi:hypothetical protein
MGGKSDAVAAEHPLGVGELNLRLDEMAPTADKLFAIADRYHTRRKRLS